MVLGLVLVPVPVPVLVRVLTIGLLLLLPVTLWSEEGTPLYVKSRHGVLCKFVL